MLGLPPITWKKEYARAIKFVIFNFQNLVINDSQKQNKNILSLNLLEKIRTLSWAWAKCYGYLKKNSVLCFMR